MAAAQQRTTRIVGWVRPLAEFYRASGEPEDLMTSETYTKRKAYSLEAGAASRPWIRFSHVQASSSRMPQVS